jgi:anti-anti-sigma factor
MRHHVPFIGERKIVRADDELARTKRTSGRVIDDVVGDGKVESSWDDVVPKGWSDPSFPVPETSASPAGVTPKVQVPFKPGTKTVKKSQNPTAKSPQSNNAAAAASMLTFSDSANMDWVPINNGRGLRISIYGTINYDLRKEWRRLLDEAEAANINEFEFNLSETPVISLTGLGMLLLFKERKGGARDAIKLCNCNKEVSQILQWTGMDKYFLIEST